MRCKVVYEKGVPVSTPFAVKRIRRLLRGKLR